MNDGSVSLFGNSSTYSSNSGSSSGSSGGKSIPISSSTSPQSLFTGFHGNGDSDSSNHFYLRGSH